MKLLPTFKTERYRKAHKNRQRYRLALICLAVLVASATGYALIHPAITMTAAAPKQISCRAVRLKATLDFTLLKSRGTEIYAAKKTPPISGHPVCSWPQNWS